MARSRSGEGYGHTTDVDVVVRGDEQDVTIASGETASVRVTDTYTAVEPAPDVTTPDLVVTKTIAGADAGRQGAVTLRVTCGGTPLAPDLVIPAGAPAGSTSRRYDVPAGQTCTVIETGDGSGGGVTSTVSGSGQSVTVPAGATAAVGVEVVDLYASPAEVAAAGYEPEPAGSLRVTKTIAGPAAGRQGPITIEVDCGGRLHAFAFRIPARTRARTVSRAFPELFPGDRCVVTETAHGGTRAVRAVTSRTRRTVTIPAGGGVTVTFRDSFFARRIAPAPVTG